MWGYENLDIEPDVFTRLGDIVRPLDPVCGDSYKSTVCMYGDVVPRLWAAEFPSVACAAKKSSTCSAQEIMLRHMVLK